MDSGISEYDLCYHIGNIAWGWWLTYIRKILHKLNKNIIPWPGTVHICINLMTIKLISFFFFIIWNFISQDCSGKVYSRVGNKHQWQDVGRAPENMPQRNQQRVEVLYCNAVTAIFLYKLGRPKLLMSYDNPTPYMHIKH